MRLLKSARTYSFAAAVYVILLFCVGCGKKRNEIPTLRFAQLPNVHGAVTLLANINGFYTNAGIDFLSISVPAGPDVVTALRAQGNASADCGSIAVTPTVTMIGSGEQPVIIATTFVSTKAQSMLAYVKSGITADAATLRGKRIGIVRNTTGDIYCARLLKKGGLAEKDLTIVNGRPSDLRSLLLRGDLDGIVLWEPFITQTKREYAILLSAGKATDGAGLTTFTDDQIYAMAINIVTTRDKLSKNREAIVQMLKATVEAGKFAHENPLKAQGQLETILKLEKGDLDAVFATTDFHVHLNIPEMTKWLGEELEWLKATRPDTKIPDDLSVFVDGSLLRSVDAKLVVD